MKTLRHDSQMMAALAAAGIDITKPDPRFFRMDAAESLFIRQELQAVEQQAYDTPFGPMKSAMLIPQDFSIPEGAQEWGYDRIQPFGLAQWLSPGGRDMPFSDVSRARVLFPLRIMGMAYRYDRDDLQAAAFAGRPLDSTLAMAARRGIDAFRDQVQLTGDTLAGFKGFINASEVTATAVAHGKWDGTGATTDQIIAEINTSIMQIVMTTREVYWPDTLVVPNAVYSYLTTTPRSANSDTTIWEFIKANNPTLKSLEMLLQLGPTSDPGGTSPATAASGGRAIFYKRDIECVVAKGSVAFDQLPPQYQGLSIQVPCFAKIGGTHWRVPISALFLDGVR